MGVRVSVGRRVSVSVRVSVRVFELQFECEH